MPVRAAVCCLLAAAMLARAAATVPADLSPPGTRVLIGLSLGSLRESPLLKGFLSGHGKAVVTAGAAITLAGIDPLRDIDTIILASTGADQTATGVAIVRGRFAGARGEGAQLYHGVPVFRDPGWRNRADGAAGGAPESHRPPRPGFCPRSGTGEPLRTIGRRERFLGRRQAESGR